MASTSELPAWHKALVLDIYPPKVDKQPTPKPGPGSAIVRILAANVLSYAKEVFSGQRPYPLQKPLTIGSSAVGRIAAIGPDTTSLKPGQLVLVDSFIQARDEPSASILSGLHEGMTEASRTLMRGEWRNSTYAEYAKCPLEQLHPFNEQRFLGSPADGGLGYTLEDLSYISTLAVPFGGLSDIRLKAGQTIIVAPATGNFGGAAVRMAVAMGARVIAMGRNKNALQRIAAGNERTEVVQMTGDMQTDLEELQKFGKIDAFFDISPPQASRSTHLKSCILALRPGGYVSLMGGQQEDVAIPIGAIMHRSIKLHGMFMYTRDDIKTLIGMAEIGVLKLTGGSGGRVSGKFKLEEWEKAFDSAAEGQASGERAVITP
ncbi:NAD(P)-binding protein [Rhizodiscina lignyota]|uniref:NAD(P)-binding protein n=1 Tax=Rhizodiscina lignyota TaxID=1504668 RepID=A0A9P4IIY8_9PEZI|nr:NAD(P)-binding protein [Rhizodiscina lignyota]